MVDENGNAITDANGNAITSGFSAKRFTSDMLKNGDAIHYTLPASVVKKYAGKKLISQVEIYFAFDTDTTNGDPWNLWTYEKDTTNEKQTVTIPAITNTYVSADNVSYTDTGISDQVNLTGLTRGNTYTLVGKIIDKSTGKVVSKSRKCTYGKDAYDITNVVPADEGNYTVNRLDTYNVYLLKKDVSSRSVNQYCNVRIYFNLQQRRMKIMKRISDELFVTGENRTYSLDDVIAIRIQDGEFYFLGWMENAERYSIQWAKSNSKIERDLLIASDDVYDAITSCKDYNKVENDWLMDDKGNLLNKDDHEYRNPYEKFLSCINPYQRNGKSDPDDHNIFLMTQKEFGDCIDALRDGDYVFVIE